MLIMNTAVVPLEAKAKPKNRDDKYKSSLRVLVNMNLMKKYIAIIKNET